MRKPRDRKRWFLYGGLAALALAGVPIALWASLTHKPSFYRKLVDQPRERREEEAKEFVSRSLQLRNDIVNEPSWEAVFSDREVNAWLAEDLVTHFADQLPPEVHEPRLAFDSDRMTLAFQLDQGPVRSVIWVVARARIPEDNVVALTLEKIRAGALPVPPDRLISTITERARQNGLEITWTKDGDLPVATIRYRADRLRNDVVLERLTIREGQIRLSGRSIRGTADVAPILPTRQVLRLNFPKRTTQPGEVDPPPAAEAAPPSGRPDDPSLNSTGPTN